MSLRLSSALLLALFVGLTCWLPLNAAKHSQTHAHHQATTHASPLCSWLCAAGQISTAEGPNLPNILGPLAHIEGHPSSAEGALVLALRRSRGPPTFVSQG